ncbi:MAG TPA: FHA domain-containing protein [Gemmataceae bacterium]|nr:FHA domain-containing protein [Gemmataceae bacterium]
MILRLSSTDPTVVAAPHSLVHHGTYLVGRGKGCDFVIKNLSVSREHAEVTIGADCIRISDLGSLNGTFVREERIRNIELKPGETVRFGNVKFQLIGLAPAEEADAEHSTNAMPVNSTSELPALAQLSESQRKVLDLLLRGRAEKAVAAKLDLSRHTVHNHVKEIYRRLNVSSRAELLALFVSESKLGNQ